MLTYSLSRRRICACFKQDQLTDNRIHFLGVDGSHAWRNIIGYKTIKRLDQPSRVRFWHFAVQARAQFFPVNSYLISSHVLFSNDGQNLWDDKKRTHSARRDQCKAWWNDDWRDRMLAMLYSLADDTPYIYIPTGQYSPIVVQRDPLRFVCPVSFAVLDGEARLIDPDEVDQHDDIAGDNTESEAIDDREAEDIDEGQHDEIDEAQLGG